MLLHELVQNGNGVQIPAHHLVALGVLAPGGDLPVLIQNQLVGKAVFQHIRVVVGVVIGENQRLFSLGNVQGVPDHPRLAVLPGGLAPDAVDVHQHIALVIDALENLVVLVHRHHVVVNAVGLAVAVKRQLRIGHHRVEKQVLHNPVPGGVGDAVAHAALRHLCGIEEIIRLRRFRPLLRGRRPGARGRTAAAGRGGRRGTAPGQRCQQQCGEKERGKSVHMERPFLQYFV